MLRGKSSCLGAQHRSVRFKAAAVAGRDGALSAPALHSAASPMLTKAQSGDFSSPSLDSRLTAPEELYARDLHQRPAGAESPLASFEMTPSWGEKLTASRAGLTQSHRLWEAPEPSLQLTSKPMCIFSRRKLGRGNEREMR